MLTLYSLGCDATSRTSSNGGASGNELGLDGHNVRAANDIPDTVYPLHTS